MARCSLATQLFHDCGNVIVLEEADGGNPRGSCGETGMGIRERDPSQGQHRDVRAACFVQKGEAGGRRVFFFEDGSEDGEGSGAGRSFGYLSWRVTGNSDQRIWW